MPGENWREELLSRSVGGAQRSPQGAQVGTGVDHWAGTPVSLLGTAMEPGLYRVKQPEALWALASRSVKWNNNDSSLFWIIVRPLGTVGLTGGVLF